MIKTTRTTTARELVIADAQAVMASLPEFNAQNAYIYFNQATRRHGFFFAPDDATAERYAQRCGLAEQSNWLIVAVVPRGE